MGQKFAKYGAPTKLVTQNHRRLSLPNLFLSTLLMLIILFLGERIRLPTIWSEGKSLLFSPKESKPES